MNTSHEYALNAKKANSILGCIRLSVTSRTRGIIHPVYIALAAPGVLCLILGSPIQKRHGNIGKSTTEGHIGNHGTGVPLLQGEAVQPGEEKAQDGTSSMCINTPGKV